MYRLILISLLAAVALGAPFRVPKPELDDFWENFKTHHNKAYKDNAEIDRRIIWEENLKYIQSHNLEADAGVHTFWLGANEYADWTNEEFVSFMNGYVRPDSATKNGSTFIKPKNMPSLPPTVDWRTDGWVTPVKSQGACGSCWTFSSTGALEGQHFRKTKTLVSLSEQNLVDCVKSHDGCGGGWMGQAFHYVVSNNGVDTEASYPYTAENNASCHYKPEYKGATITSYADIETDNEEDLKAAVATVGPISIAIDASQPSFAHYKAGVYDEPKCTTTPITHALLIVGYGTFEGKDYWLVKNSWGKSWGMNGYIMMSRNKNNQCGIAHDAIYPIL